ncbi:MAG: alpha/beta fold hydrolase [Clostridia bacterium]|nr:alpha/beta fold hydrolase [Clostridia bacterium]
MSKKLSPAITKKTVEKKPRDPKKTGKIIFICCLSVIVIAVAVWAAVGAVSAKNIIDPPRRELVYFDGPNELDMVYEFFEIKDFHGSDNIVGWYVPSQDYYGEYVESEKTVIMSHNYQSNREMTEFDGLYLIRDLVHSGYNVITFDYTGSGNSRGSNYTFGADETDELLKVIDFTCEKYSLDKIAVMGFAFGAGPAICAGCQDDRVDVIIADSPYLDLKSYLDENIAVWSQLPDFLFSAYIKSLLPVFAGTELNCSPLAAVSTAQNKSFLFLHGERDNIFPYQNTLTFASAAQDAGNTADYKVFSEVPHCLGYIYAPDDYLQTVLTFLSDNMN